MATYHPAALLRDESKKKDAWKDFKSIDSMYKKNKWKVDRVKEESIKSLNNKIIGEFPKEKLILGHGNLNSPIILIGEAPGAKEIELDQPFVGGGGKQL